MVKCPRQKHQLSVTLRTERIKNSINMKMYLVSLFALIAVVVAEPPRYSTLARQMAPPNTAPYQPSGWKPQGARLTLPARQETFQPSPSYGPPSATYGPPSASYGPPTTTDYPTTTDIDFTEEPEAESFKVTPLKGNRQTQATENIQRGQYYLLLPDGRLQRVMYVTSADLQKMSYSAKLRYMDVEPIKGPIYTAAGNTPFLPVVQQ